MKNIILSAAVLLITAATATAQNPHFDKQKPPTVTATCTVQGQNTVFVVRATGTVYGLGDASTVQAHLNYTYSATFNCYNRGSDSGPVPGQSGPVSGQTNDVTLNVTNGHATFDISFTISGSCKGNALSSTVTDVSFSKLDLVINGKTVKPSLNTFGVDIIPCN
jgi:hypothetical protein